MGPPYEATIQRIIQKGYAGNQTEVIRQALVAYERLIDEEEVQLVNKAIAFEMQELRADLHNAKTIGQLKKQYGL
ncbi:MAG: hypothetical protein Q7R47_04470 [Candidatus Diapherotrites archaeon]|nr:hypothetical protein [Candidatus Diapherotrites archaeon]